MESGISLGSLFSLVVQGDIGQDRTFSTQAAPALCLHCSWKPEQMLRPPVGNPAPKGADRKEAEAG